MAEARYAGALTAGIPSLLVRATLNGSSLYARLEREFFSSAEYRHLARLGRLFDDQPPGQRIALVRGQDRTEVDTLGNAFGLLMDTIRRGVTVQRYKGLGEMNPEQLWETTMNLETRNLMQVKIEDAVAADQIFSTLMGDQVEPRREFIERHALSVTNLDT